MIPRLLSYVVGSIHELPNSTGTQLGEWTQICNFLAPGQGTSPLMPLLPVCEMETMNLSVSLEHGCGYH